MSTSTNLEQRVAELERRTTGMPDASGMTPAEIAQGQARGTIPVGVAAPNPLGRNMELLAAHQAAWNAQPLTPEEALEQYADGEPPALCHFPQAVRLTASTNHRRVDYPRGWWLIPGCFFGLLSHGYCGCEVAPQELIARVAVWKPPAA